MNATAGQRAAEDAGGALAEPLPAAGHLAARAPAGDDPQPLPAPGVPPAAAGDSARLAGRARACTDAEREAALAAARGNPGLAARWLREGGLELREAGAGAAEAVATGRGGPVETAQRWLADETAGLRLRFAADCAGRPRRSRAARPARLDRAGDFRLSAWFDRHEPHPRAAAARRCATTWCWPGCCCEWRNMFADGPMTQRGRSRGDRNDDRWRRRKAGHSLAGDQGQGAALRRLHAVPERRRHLRPDQPALRAGRRSVPAALAARGQGSPAGRRQGRLDHAAGFQGNRAAGIGVQFSDSAEAETVKGKIETMLAGTLESDKPTHTM